MYLQCVFIVTICLCGVYNIRLCPTGGWFYHGHCYDFHNESYATFTQAQERCVRDGGNLVHVNNAEENAFLVEHVKHLRPINSWWIGLWYKDTEGEFSWIDDQSYITYQDFSAHQPDDHGSQHNEDCVLIWHKANWTWNDAKCSSQYHFVCEKGSVTDLVG
ncbi:perlucin-like protein [Mya arenaria]|uniref:perlucin-like protein n=1 Tax=Mya arenaria TaxID=6604 RepID=UPI0022E3A6C8|nr:perlucin-like protein [Mya arenaria]